MSNPRPDLIDIFGGDDPVSFHEMQDAGAVAVVLKSSQGSGHVDSKYEAFYARAITVFGPGCVHSYHFLDGSDPVAQIRHYLSVTDGKPGRWLDYEQLPSSQCSLDGAIRACHELADKQGRYPGMYGSDLDLLGTAIDAGHFAGACPIWIARYGHKPKHECDIWQYVAGETAGDSQKIGGRGLDLNQFMKGDSEACAAWMKSLAA